MIPAANVAEFRRGRRRGSKNRVKKRRETIYEVIDDMDRAQKRRQVVADAIGLVGVGAGVYGLAKHAGLGSKIANQVRKIEGGRTRVLRQKIGQAYLRAEDKVRDAEEGFNKARARVAEKGKTFLRRSRRRGGER